MQYRPDIDGLRAVAVVPVLLFHAGVPQFAGGFVGVDVFFVISGYLITALITAEIDEGRFSILGFYQRRCRRILPVLYVVMGFSAVVGYCVYTPDELKRLGQAIVATTLFVSNILFWSQADYFEPQIDERPLLHTWSLGIEEQFYATFPIYILLVSRFIPAQRCALTVVMCVSSFLLGAWTIHIFPSATFYLAPTRAWELLIGALIALKLIPKADDAKWHGAAGFAGLTMIGAAVTTYSERTLFPGAAAALPALGAACIIWAGLDAASLVNRWLSQRWIVLLGKISYSLYLWHFTLLTFASYLSITRTSPLVVAAVLVASLGLAVLSWRFVEQPFRQTRNSLNLDRQLLAGVAVPVCLFLAVGLSAYASGGFPARLSSADAQILAEAVDVDPDRLNCALYGAPQGKSCRLGAQSQGAPQFALWGDSHAEAWRPALDVMGSLYKKTGIFVGRVACAPVIGVKRLDEPECISVNEKILQLLLATPSIRTVVLSARWGLWSEGSRYKNETRRPATVNLVALDDMPAGSKQNHTALAAGLRRTIATLRANAKEVWLVGPVPEVGYPVPKAMHIQRLEHGINQELDIRPTREEYRQRQAFVISLLDQLQKEFAIKVIWPDRTMCDLDHCQIAQNGKPLYSDDNHLSVFGATALKSLFEPIFE
jgi:peptidoglycan/LPS O-acetylase OafA/YrhL